MTEVEKQPCNIAEGEGVSHSMGSPGTSRPRDERPGQSGRTSLVLTAAQLEFIERLCARIRRDTGVRFTKAVLIRVLVAILVESGIPLAEVRTETHLKETLRAAAPRMVDGPTSEWRRSERAFS